MRTKLYHPAELTAVLQSADSSCIPTKESLRDYVVRELTRGHIFYVPCPVDEPIHQSDRVTLRVSSVLSRFNREKVSVCVGAGLYNTELEAAMKGRKVGESGAVVVKGESVSFDILHVERPCRPVPTDEMAQGMELDGITTVAQFSAYILKQKQDEWIKRRSAQLLDQVILRSGLSAVDPQDIRDAMDLAYGSMRNRFLHSGTDLDELSSEEWSRTIYSPKSSSFMEKYNPEMAKLAAAPDKQAYYDLLRPEAERSIQCALVLCALLGKADERAYDPTIRLHAEAPLIEEFTEKIRTFFIKKG